MSKKDLLSNFIFKNNLISKTISKRKQKDVHVLAYHRVAESLSTDYLFNSEVFSSTLSEFDKQMRYVSENFNVINFAKFEDALRNDAVESDSVIITFDDGYYDNYSLAAPVLDKYNIGATVFLATDYIDSGDLFWFDLVAGFMKNYDKSKLTIESIGLSFDFSQMTNMQAFKIVGRKLKDLSDDHRIQLISEIKDKFKFTVSDEAYQQAKPLSWDNVTEMSRNNIEFGSHTKSHCFLNCIGQDSLKDEIIGSIEKIENKISQKVNSFCYPAGVTNESIKRTVEACGLYFGVGYRHGVSSITNIDRYDLYREHVELDVNYDLFRANLMLPELFMRKG